MVLGMTIMVILNFFNVIFRVLFPQTPFSYSEELTIIIFMWVTMFGISYGFKANAHTKLDVFTKLLPKKAQPLVTILATLCALLFMGILVYTSYLTMLNQITYNQVTPGMKLPMVVNSGAIFLGSIISMFSVVRAGHLELNAERGELEE